MTKSDLVELVARKAHLTKKGAEEAIDVFLNEIGRALGKGEKRVLLSGFGTFYSIRYDKKTVKIPKTEKAITIPSHRAPKFTAGKKFKRQVSR